MSKKNKDILDGSLCYLIGAMDNAKDNGRGWRADIINLCTNSNLKIKFLDPTNKLAGLYPEVGEEHRKILSLKKQHKWENLTKSMKKIVRQDHRCVDLSDFVIFYLDIKVHTCGSYFEFRSALAQKKPYFVIVPTGKDTTPSWLFGICDHKNIYKNSTEVVKHLININSGLEKMSDRWVLFRKQIKEL